MPGGRLDEGESLLDGAAREFQEETGLTPDKESMQQIPTVFEGDIQRKSGEMIYTYWSVFLVRHFTGELIGSDETVPGWIPIDEIQLLENLLPNTYEAVKEGLQLLQR